MDCRTKKPAPLCLPCLDEPAARLLLDMSAEEFGFLVRLSDVQPFRGRYSPADLLKVLIAKEREIALLRECVHEFARTIPTTTQLPARAIREHVHKALREVLLVKMARDMGAQYVNAQAARRAGGAPRG